MVEDPGAGPDFSRQEGVSLDELTRAFAEAMGAAPAVAQPASAQQVAGTEEAKGTPAAEPAADLTSPPTEPSHDACELSPRTILEAMLFVGNRDNQPLLASRAAELMRGVEPGEVARLVDELNRRYAANGAPYYIVHEGSGYRMTLRRPFHALRNRFYGRIREARLSQAAIDVLALVAYQQPLSGEQISRLRGRPCSHVLSQLVRRGLLRIERRQGKPRVTQYFTTDRFLELFGLESLRDLPQSEDLERL